MQKSVTGGLGSGLRETYNDIYLRKRQEGRRGQETPKARKCANASRLARARTAPFPTCRMYGCLMQRKSVWFIRGTVLS